MSGLMPPGPLSYEGQIATPFINRSGPPTTSNINFDVPTLWVDTVGKDAYLLVSKANGVATWSPIGGEPGQVETLTGNSGGAVSPDGNNTINILGQSGQVVVTGNPGTNTLTISLAGAGTAVDTFTTNLSGPVTPTGAGVVLVNASTSTFTDGSVANTLKTEVQGTNHALFIGAGANVVPTMLAPGTTAFPLVSQGAASNPAYQLLTVPGGGTGAATLTGIVTANGTSAMTANAVTQHGILIGGASNAAASLGVATNGQLPIGSTGADPVLAAITPGAGISVTNGAGSITIATTAFSSINNQVFTTSGTYTPTAGMAYCQIQVVGGGGGAGAANTSGANQCSAGGGGGSGGYAIAKFTAAQIGASQAVTIGAGGAGATTNSSNGVAGGTTSVGVLITANGGGGGQFGAAGQSSFGDGGDGGGAGTGGDFKSPGSQGASGIGLLTSEIGGAGVFGTVTGGYGASGPFGGGVNGNAAAGSGSTNPGQSGNGFGAGGSGGGTWNAATAAGGTGAGGAVIITEFII